MNNFMDKFVRFLIFIGISAVSVLVGVVSPFAGFMIFVIFGMLLIID